MSPKESRLEALRGVVAQCRNCPLYKSRPHMVFGEGSPDAVIMFVGEGPGSDEQRTGRPFVGRSGKLLRNMMAAIGVPEDRCYIANVVKDRPPNNRPPEPGEIEACSKFLKKQIEIIAPKCLVLLGRTAVKALLPGHEATPLDAMRGLKGSLVYSENAGEVHVPVLVTYHPSALLKGPWRKAGAKEDFLFLKSAYEGFVAS